MCIYYNIFKNFAKGLYQFINRANENNFIKQVLCDRY